MQKLPITPVACSVWQGQCTHCKDKPCTLFYHFLFAGERPRPLHPIILLFFGTHTYSILCNDSFLPSHTLHDGLQEIGTTASFWQKELNSFVAQMQRYEFWGP